MELSYVDVGYGESQTKTRSLTQFLLSLLELDTKNYLSSSCLSQFIFSLKPLLLDYIMSLWRFMADNNIAGLNYLCNRC